MNRHIYVCPIRWGDMDAQAHVNNTYWVDYLQEARVDFLLRGPLAAMLDSGVVVVSHAVEYRAPVVADGEPMRIELWVDSVGAARFSISYELFHREVMVGRAQTVLTPYDLTHDTVRRLTDSERTALETTLAPAIEMRPMASQQHAEPARIPLSVRWSDLDAYGHVNNVMFYEYIQEARISFLSREFSTDEGMWVVARQDVRYLRPMPFRLEPYLTTIGITAMGRSSFTVAAQVLDPLTDEVFARAHTVVVCTDRHGRPREISAEVRAAAGQQAPRA